LLFLQCKPIRGKGFQRCVRQSGRGPQPKLSLQAIFNYILKLLHLRCQWKELPIEKDRNGQPEIHHSSIYRAFRRFETHGYFEDIFKRSVTLLQEKGHLDTSVIHGDGTTTAAKKGGDNLEGRQGCCLL